jgi:hypothetical protein
VRDRRRMRRRFRVSFRRAGICTIWRLGFRQFSFHHIARVPRRTVPDTWTRPPVSCHALVPLTFRRQVRHQTHGHPSNPSRLRRGYNEAPRGAPLTCRCQSPTAPDRMNAKTRGKMWQNSPPPKNRRVPQLAPLRPREALPTEPSPLQSLPQHQVRRTPPRRSRSASRLADHQVSPGPRSNAMPVLLHPSSSAAFRAFRGGHRAAVKAVWPRRTGGAKSTGTLRSA